MTAKKLTQKKFRTKVLAIFLVIVIVPILLIFISNLYLVIKGREVNIVEQQQLAVDNANEKIVKYLHEKSKGLNLVVSAPLESIRELNFNDMNFLLKSSFEASQPVALDFIDNNGFIVAKINSKNEFIYNKNYINLLTKTASSTTKLRVKQISDIESDVGESPDFKAASTGEEYYGLLEFTNTGPAMRIASQIQNQNDEIIGVISAEIDLREVEKSIKEISLGERGYLYIIDKNGVVVASANKQIAKVGDNLFNNKNIKEYIASENKIAKQFAAQLNHDSDYTTTKLRPKSKFTTYLNNNKERVSWSARDITVVNWYIMSEWPITDAFSVLKKLLIYSMIIIIVIILVVVILGVIFTKTITKPISVLAKGAEEIKEGNLDYTINLKTNDEFEILAGRFNEMTKVIKENQKLRDEFVFIAAHELRTPVTAIRGYLSMVLDNSFGDVPAKIKDNLLIVNQANDRLVQLVQDLLQVARSEAGKMTIDMKKVVITDTIIGVMNELKSLSDEKNIAVEYNQSKKFSVMTDEYKLNEVIVNLLGNSIKYTTSSGGIQIWHEEKDGFVITYIKDHGIGMTKEEQSKLFSKFYRVQNDETTQIQGTGLGLFICKEIIKRMGGEIKVESSKGEGSMFSFSLKKP